MKLEQFIAKWLGKPCDYDGSFGSQCYDLYRFYCKEVLNIPQSPPTAGASGIWDVYLKEYFNRISNTPEGIPNKGDIVIWNKNAGGGFGHVAIFIEGTTKSFTSFDCNWPIGSLPHIQGHYYTNVCGWLQPKGEPMTNEATLTDAKNWQELRKRSLDWNLKEILGHEVIESVADCEKVFNLAQNIKTDSNNWNAIRKIYKVESVEELDKMITALKNSSPCTKLLKEAESNCVKKIEDLEDTHEEKVSLLVQQILDPCKLTKLELLMLFLRIKPKEYEQNKKKDGENVVVKK